MYPCLRLIVCDCGENTKFTKFILKILLKSLFNFDQLYMYIFGVHLHFLSRSVTLFCTICYNLGENDSASFIDVTCDSAAFGK